MACNGKGYLDCYCAGDHCACGYAGSPQCDGCAECTVDPAEESLFLTEPSIGRRPMGRALTMSSRFGSCDHDGLSRRLTR